MFEYIALGGLFLFNIITLIYHFLYVKEANKERKDLVKALMARDLPEYDTSIRSEKKEPGLEREEPEFVPMSEAIENDRIFEKMLKNEMEGNE